MHNDPVGACGVCGVFECSLNVNNVEIDADLIKRLTEFVELTPPLCNYEKGKTHPPYCYYFKELQDDVKKLLSGLGV